MLSRSNPPGVSPPTGPYSLVSTVPAGVSLAWLAGQTGRREDGTLTEDSTSQTEDAFANLGVLMDSLGASPSDIACLRTYLTSGAQQGFYRGRNRIFSNWYPDGDYPPNTLLVVSGLADPRAMVEIEAVLALG
jgi:enamine deaminase RidA (YjgF/YER057c/UK114 family)